LQQGGVLVIPRGGQAISEHSSVAAGDHADIDAVSEAVANLGWLRVSQKTLAVLGPQCERDGLSQDAVTTCCGVDHVLQCRILSQSALSDDGRPIDEQAA
jgi:hypothetical protein